MVYKELFNKNGIVINKEKRKNKFSKKVLEKMDQKVVVMNAIEHDKIFAITSHLPHLIAYAT